jgi:hypothetical protein
MGHALAGRIEIEKASENRLAVLKEVHLLGEGISKEEFFWIRE